MSEEEESVKLKTVIGGILQGLREAKYLGDLESVRLHEAYKENPVLTRLPVPAFSISDIEVELKFATVEPPEELIAEGKVSDLKVIISAHTIKMLEPHQVHVMKLKMTPTTLRVLEEGV